MRRLNKKVLWITVAIAFIIAIGLICICPFTKDGWTKIVIVLLAIDFIFLTIAVQAASFQTFRYKEKKENYPTKEYRGNFNIFYQTLKDLNYKERKTNYGSSFLKIKKDIAYKCVLVEDYAAYFEPQEEQKSESNSKLEQCKIFVGLEIFKSIDEKNVMKLPDFTLKGKNIYYTALLKQEDKLICLNYSEPEDRFKEAFYEMLSELKIEEIKEE